MPSWGREEAPEILVRLLPHAEGLGPPGYATAGAVGMDLAAAVTEELILEPGENCLVPTGVAVAVPEGYEAQIRPRSGSALRHGIIVPNSPGTVDPDYRGEIRVILHNLGREPFTIRRGMRIAQMVIVPAPRARVTLADELPGTPRGEGGFGHTGS